MLLAPLAGCTSGVTGRSGPGYDGGWVDTRPGCGPLESDGVHGRWYPHRRAQLWVVSESGTRHYQDQGGRPVVPMLLRLDVSDFASWRRPGCEV